MFFNFKPTLPSHDHRLINPCLVCWIKFYPAIQTSNWAEISPVQCNAVLHHCINKWHRLLSKWTFTAGIYLVITLYIVVFILNTLYKATEYSATDCPTQWRTQGLNRAWAKPKLPFLSPAEGWFSSRVAPLLIVVNSQSVTTWKPLEPTVSQKRRHAHQHNTHTRPLRNS